ncbi:MAG TPA: pyridoxamine 5'-phosphate oxidase family protein [Baekduia sp.]|nr:pyridoxamine 5'-phosphate oxidase family protein [Baekduia sp.]
MTATLPSDLREVFARCTVAELVTIDQRGRPVARSVSPTYHEGGPSIAVADDEGIADPHVALLFAGDGPMVLVQGTAVEQEVLHVRPERVYAWDGDAPEVEPRLFDAHIEEVRSGHNEEPEVEHAAPEGGHGLWDHRLDYLNCALLACIGPDGFPFAARLMIAPDPRVGVLRLPHLPVGMPVEPGPACLHATDAGHAEGRGPRVHGDLLAGPDGWRLVPHMVLDA